MRWGIYFREREYARAAGDPLLAVVEAENKEDAERLARDAGVASRGAGVWAYPLVHGFRVQDAAVIRERKPAGGSDPRGGGR